MPRRKHTGPCTANNCERPYYSKGFCMLHYHRMRYYGTTDATGQARDPEIKFWDKVQKTETCWLWTGLIDRKGYGVFQRLGPNNRAHRFSYKLTHGEDSLPDDITIDHLCRVRHCVNPQHLEPVSLAENSARAWRSRKAEHASP